jgi:hypothetical protein
MTSAERFGVEERVAQMKETRVIWRRVGLGAYPPSAKLVRTYVAQHPTNFMQQVKHRRAEAFDVSVSGFL